MYYSCIFSVIPELFKNNNHFSIKKKESYKITEGYTIGRESTF